MPLVGDKVPIWVLSPRRRETAPYAQEHQALFQCVIPFNPQPSREICSASRCGLWLRDAEMKESAMKGSAACPPLPAGSLREAAASPCSLCPGVPDRDQPQRVVICPTAGSTPQYRAQKGGRWSLLLFISTRES